MANCKYRHARNRAGSGDCTARIRSGQQATAPNSDRAIAAGRIAPQRCTADGQRYPEPTTSGTRIDRSAHQRFAQVAKGAGSSLDRVGG